MKNLNQNREDKIKQRSRGSFHWLVALAFFMIFLPVKFCAQTKIGGVPGPSDSNAYLQLGDKDATKGFLMPRVSLASTKQAAPLTAHVAGMQVYNTVSVNDVTPGVYYNDGSQWVRLSIGSSQTNINADNGLTANGQTIGLGGNLTQPTEIKTSGTNTLAISGLAAGQASDNIVTVDPATGILRQISASSLNSGMIKQQIIAASGQRKFNTPFQITSLDKIQVFRNGAEVEFTASVGGNQVDLQLYSDTNGACFDGDEIKIYQWK